jgi:CheY-like chemotaxis protein
VVADDGGGMADEALRRIFEPFFTTKEPGRGTGLGMAMAYGLMKQQGGWLNVNSAPGAGTTVRLHFPIPAPEPLLNEVDTPPPRSVPEPGARVRTILLVEDDAPLRRASTAVLKTLGYRVLVAADGEEALELYRVHCANLSLIVTDVVMPRLGGWELIRQIRHQDRDIPFLVVSGYAGGAGAAAELNDPRVTFLEKPWTMAELAAGAQRCLEAVPVQA